MATDFGKTEHADTLEAEERFGSLLESMPDAMVVANQAGRIVLANCLAEDLFDYLPGELSGLALEALLPKGPEACAVRKGGDKFPADVRSSQLRDGDKQLQVHAVRDISELAKASQAKERFLGSMSHELRTPLNAIIGFTGTLLMQLPGPLNADQDKQLRTVQASARHLLSLINDLLDFAKIGSGKVELHPEPLNCRAVVEELALVCRPQARQKGLVLRLRAPAQAVMLRTDRRALQQILGNLLNNAIKFTERGEVSIALERSMADGKAVVQVSVSDTGTGVTEDIMQQLGIRLSQKLAALLNGSIRHFDKPGNGSIFVLTLPLE
ncbi:PAS domain S-box-containing protein [Duganella sp. CF458]|uniref:sensor histidine kinase n=1 Tax=Duganella sp. CF458 TaxID=1884368 RepID=UPI0008E97302|nr:histidine kinase dimerization/phospho-acceptor domain-containing protein [Duganella sp. CF458]SFF83614.1 PAS domain S-box-containing protein [Duganella sp. CF458]